MDSRLRGNDKAGEWGRIGSAIRQGLDLFVIVELRMKAGQGKTWGGLEVRRHTCHISDN